VRNVVQHRVRYHEADAQGFMFNSRFLELADVGMTEFFRAIGIPYGELLAAGADPSVVRAGIDFRRPARFEDVLDVAVTCTRVGGASFDLAMAVTRDGEEIADIQLTYVNVDAREATSRPLPDAVAQALRGEALDPSVDALEIHQ
jgi:acyl-CoA thioester hydrolase